MIVVIYKHSIDALWTDSNLLNIRAEYRMLHNAQQRVEAAPIQHMLANGEMSFCECFETGSLQHAVHETNAADV